MDLSKRLWGIKYSVCGVYSPEPRAEVNCLQLNFKKSKLVYCLSPADAQCVRYVNISSRLRSHDLATCNIELSI